jgi:hypothetical protein
MKMHLAGVVRNSSMFFRCFLQAFVLFPPPTDWLFPFAARRLVVAAVAVLWMFEVKHGPVNHDPLQFK